MDKLYYNEQSKTNQIVQNNENVQINSIEKDAVRIKKLDNIEEEKFAFEVLKQLEGGRNSNLKDGGTIGLVSKNNYGSSIIYDPAKELYYYAFATGMYGISGAHHPFFKKNNLTPPFAEQKLNTLPLEVPFRFKDLPNDALDDFRSLIVDGSLVLPDICFCEGLDMMLKIWNSQILNSKVELINTFLQCYEFEEAVYIKTLLLTSVYQSNKCVARIIPLLTARVKISDLTGAQLFSFGLVGDQHRGTRFITIYEKLKEMYVGV